MRLGWLILLAWATTVAPASALARDEVIPLESPAYFVEAVGGYAYRDTAEKTKTVNGNPQTVFGSVSKRWLVGGRVTVPIWNGFGARGTIFGGGDDLSLGGAPSTDLKDFSVGASGFWRDPTKGQVGAGYRYTDTDVSPATTVQSITTHSIPVYAALYMPDFGGGTTVDWRVDFEYDFIGSDTPSGRVDQWAYDVLLTSKWYLNGYASFDGRFLYDRSIGASQSDRIEGILALEILVPSGKRNYATFELFGGYGRDRSFDVGAVGNVKQRIWQVGFQASVFFPGVATLVELNRAYR